MLNKIIDDLLNISIDFFFSLLFSLPLQLKASQAK